MASEWVRSIRDQCDEQNVAFFFKQWGGTRKKQAGRELDGRTWNATPLPHPSHVPHSLSGATQAL